MCVFFFKYPLTLFCYGFHNKHTHSANPVVFCSDLSVCCCTPGLPPPSSSSLSSRISFFYLVLAGTPLMTQMRCGTSSGWWRQEPGRDTRPPDDVAQHIYSSLECSEASRDTWPEYSRRLWAQGTTPVSIRWEMSEEELEEPLKNDI